MKNSEKKQFQTVFNNLSEYYQKENLTKPALEIYWGALSRLSLPEVEQGINQHVSNELSGKFYPRASDILAGVFAGDKQKANNAKNSSLLAWSQVIYMISTRGPYRTLTLDDKVALAAVKSIGGWVCLCKKTYEQLEWAKKDFYDVYQAYIKTPLNRLPSSLPGLPELSEGKGTGSTLRTLYDELERRENNKQLLTNGTEK